MVLFHMRRYVISTGRIDGKYGNSLKGRGDRENKKGGEGRKSKKDRDRKSVV